MFLSRIEECPVKQSRILWDCSKSPLLLEKQSLPNLRIPIPSNDILLRYVPLNNPSGISLAFCSEELLAIITHDTRIQDHTGYSKAPEDAIWIYCPLQSSGNEPDTILEIWSVRHIIPNLNSSALIVCRILKRLHDYI